MTGGIGQLFHHSPDWWSALGTVSNAAIVFILAVLNVLYLQVARRQAKAAERQTEEIKDQIVLSREQLYVMRDALRLSFTQENITRRSDIMMVVGELRKSDAKLRKLSDLMAQPAPGLPHTLEDGIVPLDWNLIARCIERELDKEKHLDQTLHLGLLKTSGLSQGKH
jgi:hypothetical protein